MRAGNEGRASKSGAQHSSTISRSAGGTGAPQLQATAVLYQTCPRDATRGSYAGAHYAASTWSRLPDTPVPRNVMLNEDTWLTNDPAQHSQTLAQKFSCIVLS